MSDDVWLKISILYCIDYNVDANESNVQFWNQIAYKYLVRILYIAYKLMICKPSLVTYFTSLFSRIISNYILQITNHSDKLSTAIWDSMNIIYSILKKECLYPCYTYSATHETSLYWPHTSIEYSRAPPKWSTAPVSARKRPESSWHAHWNKVK